VVQENVACDISSVLFVHLFYVHGRYIFLIGHFTRTH